MNDDDDNTMSRSVSGIVMTIVFVIVAMVITTSVALPMLLTAGNTTVTETNEGVYMSPVNENYLKRVTTKFDQNSQYLFLNENGFGIAGTVNGAPASEILLPIDKFNRGYPICLYNTGSASGITMYECNGSGDTLYQKTSLTESISEGSFNLTGAHEYYVQDSKGAYSLTKNGIMIEEGDPYMAFHISEYSILTYNNGNGYMSTYDGVDTTVTPVTPIVTSTSGDYITIQGVTYNLTSCDYFLGPRSVSYTDNIIEGTIIQTLIGIIPLLLILGIVLYVANKMKLSNMR